MNIFDLFLTSSILVKITILILMSFSVMSWSIILNRIFSVKIAQRNLKSFENKFWSGISLSCLYKEISIKKNKSNNSEYMFYIGFKEFSKLYQIKHCLIETINNRVLRVMRNTMYIELEELENYIPLIGIIGSISPYIGLFGTIFGIIHVFIELEKVTLLNNQIGHLQIVAPGISEALISTAIGLVVAIPAVMAFNYLTIQINYLNQKYDHFIEEFITILYHQIYLKSHTKIYNEKEFEGKTSEIQHDSI